MDKYDRQVRRLDIHRLINAPEGWEPSDDKPMIILSCLKEEGSCKTFELSAIRGLKPTQTKAYLFLLLKEGKIVAQNRTYTLA